MNPKHVRLVKEGTNAINAWGDERPGEHLDLSGADLRSEFLAYANLSGANFMGTNLFNAVLFKANLAEANLSGANLTMAIAYDTDFSGANLVETNLFTANLMFANFSYADLSMADLKGSQLIRADLTQAVLTGAKLYGSARDDWDITGIECRYVFWDVGGQKRSPHDRYLDPGEFEAVYAQLPTIEYIFENGLTALDPVIMDFVVQSILERTPELDLKIESINVRGFQPTIRFTVREESQKEQALAEITRDYELKAAGVEGQRDILLQLVNRVIDQPNATNLIQAESGGMIALQGSTINVDQTINYLTQLEEAIENTPPETLSAEAKSEAKKVVGDAIKDVAKGQVKAAAEKVIELGVRLGPVVSPTILEFFKGIAGG